MNIAIGPIGLLGVLFVALKLTKVITWAWLWVLAPFWLPAATAIGFISVLCALALIFDR